MARALLTRAYSPGWCGRASVLVLVVWRSRASSASRIWRDCAKGLPNGGSGGRARVFIKIRIPGVFARVAPALASSCLERDHAALFGQSADGAMAVAWSNCPLPATFGAGSLSVAVVFPFGSGCVSSHSLRAATSGSIMLLRHHDASSPER